jgi:hypothetical protein
MQRVIKMVARTICTGALALCRACAAGGGRAAESPQVWLRGVDPIVRPLLGPNSTSDFMDLFDPKAAWSEAASQVKVFLTSTQFFSGVRAGGVERNVPDQMLTRMFEDLKRRHIALAVEALMLSPGDGECGVGVEGYSAPGQMLAIAKRIKALGGTLSYVAMDGPLMGGHFYSGPRACHSPVEAIAREVAEKVRQIRTVFPDVKVGDVEPVGVTEPAGWANSIIAWNQAYKAAVGEPLAFLHCDMQWRGPWQEQLRKLEAQLRADGTRIGVIYNGFGADKTDEEWVQHAEDHFNTLERNASLVPDVAIIQTWDRHPARFLPETQPGTLTYLVGRYLRAASALSLTRQGNVIAGQLIDAQGRPVADASIAITGVDAGARTQPTMRSVAGTTPADVASAVIGIRAGNEGACVCNGEAGAVIGDIRYQEKGSGRRETVSLVDLPIAGVTGMLRTLKLTPGQSFNPNLKQFPVTAGTPYTFEAGIAATASAEHAGYAAIIFIDAKGKELKRELLWFSPSQRDVGTAATDPGGRFAFTLPETTALARPEIRVAFAGNDGLRPALAVAEPQAAGAAVMPALLQPLSDSARRSKLVWFSPRQQDLVPIFGGSLEKPWNDIAGRVNVLGVTEGMVRSLPDETLARLVQDLDRRHIALGLGILPTNWWHEPPCGGGVEGYSDPGSANQTVAKLMKTGASVSLIEMDEPLWFGHYYTGKNACRSSIENVAERTAVIVKIYTAAFPNVVVGDGEPFPAVSSQPNWAADFAAWPAAFRKATGTPLAFLNLDFNWGDPRLNTGSAHDGSNAAAVVALAREVSTVARRNGLRVGMFYWGGGSSDAQWMDWARMHIREVEAAGVDFDFLRFVSWNPYPARTFPATDPNALASLIPYYFQHHR